MPRIKNRRALASHFSKQGENQLKIAASTSKQYIQLLASTDQLNKEINSDQTMEKIQLNYGVR